MAENYKKGTAFLFYIDAVTPITTALDEVTFGANAKLVKCLTSNGFSGSRETLASASKCAGQWAESEGDTGSWSMDVSAEALKLATLDDSIDQNAMFKLWRAGTKVWGFMKDIDSDGDLRYGVIRVDNYTETGAKGSIKEFTATLTGIGEPGDQDDLATV